MNARETRRDALRGKKGECPKFSINNSPVSGTSFLSCNQQREARQTKTSLAAFLPSSPSILRLHQQFCFFALRPRLLCIVSVHTCHRWILDRITLMTDRPATTVPSNRLRQLPASSTQSIYKYILVIQSGSLRKPSIPSSNRHPASQQQMIGYPPALWHGLGLGLTLYWLALPCY